MQKTEEFIVKLQTFLSNVNVRDPVEICTVAGALTLTLLALRAFRAVVAMLFFFIQPQPPAVFVEMDIEESEDVLEGYEKEVDGITADGAHLCWIPHARVQTANATHGTHGEPSGADWQRYRSPRATSHIQSNVESTQRGNESNRTHASRIPKTSRKGKGSSARQTSRSHWNSQ